MEGCLHTDLGRGTVVALPAAEIRERWEAATADSALAVKAAMFAGLGIRVCLCGNVNLD
jgi:hypothetical protein